MMTDFRVIPETGFGGYSLSVPGLPSQAVDVVLDGEWGAFTATEAFNPAPPIEGNIPGNGGYIDLADEVTFTWTPGDGALYMEVELEVNGIHELWLLTDDGTHTLPASHFGALGPSDIVTITLYRIVDQDDIDVNGNLLGVNAVDKVQFATGNAQPPSCKHHYDANPAAPSGEYLIAPNPAEPPVAVWCDMTTDGGGWTLVSSTNATMNDEAVNYNNNLTTLSPTSSMTGIWDKMRSAIPGNSDIRFACKLNGSAPDMTVDLSFYANNWYREITSGADIDSCFNESNGAGATSPPERRNNLNGATLAAGNAWAAGYLEGEDSCSDTGDFTVDFDDRGMDSDQSDGTDWGEDDSTAKCG
ncbi:MAG: hypothetical protein GWP91_16845, partial [Rhodobacterales bacterium]|nr:hypothetical protein [Rhodobacterales bacterium]